MDYSTVAKTCLILLAVNAQLVSAASHSLQYFYTAVTPGIHFAEYTVVGLVDGEQFVYYDSNIKKVVPKTEWMERNEGEEYWDRETEKAQTAEENFKMSVGTIMQRFNHTEGVHTVQRMYGCELHDDGTKRGYRQEGYDGEDFISLDLDTLTWTAANTKAVITKRKWEKTGAAHVKDYLENECIEWLEKYVGFGRSTLERKVPPEVSLFRKDSSSPVVCHATGFYPKTVMISWQKNGEDLDEGVEIRETLPNLDGTFQKRSILTVPPEELDKNKYTCVVQHGGLEKKLQFSDITILPPGASNRMRHTVIILVAFQLVLLICAVGVFYWRKKQSGFKPVSENPKASSNGDSSSNYSKRPPS